MLVLIVALRVLPVAASSSLGGPLIRAIFPVHLFELVIAQEHRNIFLVDSKPAENVSRPQHLVLHNLLEEDLDLTDDSLSLLREDLSHADVLSFWIRAHSLICLHVLRLHFVKDPLRDHGALLSTDRFVPLVLGHHQSLQL